MADMGNGKNKVRKSSFELLRILAMLMIVADHYVLQNGVKVSDIQGGASAIDSFVLYSFFLIPGKIGVAIFFGLTVWFLADRDLSLKYSIKKIFQLEKEVFFYSIVFLVINGVSERSISLIGIIKSVFPLITGEYWFVTAYAISILFIPYLNLLINKLDEKRHQYLVIFALFLSTFGVLFPDAYAMKDCFVPLLLEYIVISYIRLHMRINDRQLLVRIVFPISVVLLLVYEAVAIGMARGCHNPLFENIRIITLPVQNSSTFFALGCAIPLILIFENFFFQSRFINTVSSCMFGVYLIHCNPFIEKILFEDWFLIGRYKPVLISSLIAVLIIFVTCALIDYARKILFRFTFDKVSLPL